MRKKTPKRKPNPANSLLKTGKKQDIELTEEELGNVAGGTLSAAVFGRSDVKDSHDRYG